MATITPVTTYPQTGGPAGERTVIVTTWNAIGDSDTCTGVSIPGFTDQTVHVIGSFSNASVAIQGSNNNVNWVGLTDPLGTTLANTSTYLRNILQNPLWIRPSSTGGSSSSTTVILVSKR